MAENLDSWHFDKRVPIALIIALFIQTGGMVWWAATMQADVTSAVRSNERQDVRIDALAAVIQQGLVQNARVETELSSIRQSQLRSERMLDQLNQNFAPSR